MIKTLFHQIGAYKKDSILTPIYAAAEVIMEILIPFVTAAIIDEGIQAGNMQKGLQSAGEYVSEHTDLFLFQY